MNKHIAPTTTTDVSGKFVPKVTLLLTEPRMALGLVVRMTRAAGVGLVASGDMITDAKHTFGVIGYDVSDKSNLWAKVAA